MNMDQNIYIILHINILYLLFIINNTVGKTLMTGIFSLFWKKYPLLDPLSGLAGPIRASRTESSQKTGVFSVFGAFFPFWPSQKRKVRSIPLKTREDFHRRQSARVPFQ